MDASAAGPLVTTLNAGPPDAAVPGVPSGPGWLVLRDCPLGGGGPPLGLALLHPKIGVALVDLDDAAADAPDRLRRALDERRFAAIFGGYPPVVRVVLPADRLPELGQILSARFRAEPPFALEGGDAWVPTARAALEAKPASGVPAAPDSGRKRDVPPLRAAALVVAAAVSGAAVAAVVVMPPWRGTGPAPGPETAVVAAAPKPAPLPWTAPPPAAERAPPPAAERAPPPAAERAPPPAAERAAGLEANLPHAAATADTAADGGNRAAAAAAAVAATVPPDAESGGPSPVAAAASEGGPESAPADGPPDASGPAALAAEPMPFAAVAPPPDPSGGAGGPDVPARARAAVAPASAAPPRAVAAAPRAAPAPAAADTAGEKRCRDILVKTTLGEGLSDADKEHMRRRCQRPRD